MLHYGRILEKCKGAKMNKVSNCSLINDYLPLGPLNQAINEGKIIAANKEISYK